jgi:alpha-L-rhamnosidase
MNSFNHYAYGAIGAWLYSGVSGIDSHPSGVGYQKILLKPRPSRKLSWVDASYESIQGKISSRWKYEKEDWLWDVEVPANCSAEIVLPIQSMSRTSLNGVEIEKSDLLLSKIVKSDKSLTFEIGSGTYQFKVTSGYSF